MSCLTIESFGNMWSHTPTHQRSCATIFETRKIWTVCSRDGMQKRKHMIRKAGFIAVLPLMIMARRGRAREERPPPLQKLGTRQREADTAKIGGEKQLMLANSNPILPCKTHAAFSRF